MHLHPISQSDFVEGYGRIYSAHIVNSVDFANKISRINLNTGKMLSLDVDSLFTRVPIEDILAILEEKLPDLNLDLPISLSKFIKLIKLCISDSVFRVGDDYYRQVYGMGMGNPLSPILCNLFMEHFESTLLPRIVPKPIPWLRYVDDIFSVWPEGEDFDAFLANLNNLHRTIKFKFEWEVNGSLPFLDVKIIKIDMTRKLCIYRKPTSSSAYIHYFSCHDDNVKIATISGLFLRAYRICDPTLLIDELTHIFQIFLNLQYPPWYIEKAHLKARKTFYNTQRDRPVFSSYLVLPYSPVLTNVSRLFKNNGIGFAFSYNKTLYKTLTRNSPKSVDMGGVYSISCRDCTNNRYIGQTGRPLTKRAREHELDVRRGNEKSSFYNHVSNTNHFINYDNIKSIYKSNNVLIRKIVESSLITEFENFNLDDGQYKFKSLLHNFVFKHVKKKLDPF